MASTDNGNMEIDNFIAQLGFGRVTAKTKGITQRARHVKMK
jgi:hypothetical protein